jgi:hypothetical protein
MAVTADMKLSAMVEFPDWLVSYLTGDFPFSPELQAFWMAFQGAMVVRAGPNKDKSMNWFHAFMLSIVCGYGGACFTPLWMGQNTSMLSNDLNLAACIIAFILVNYVPFDIGFKLGTTFPVTIITTTFAQLFRSLGLVKFTTIAFNAFKDSPSAYYPIPVFGPIAYGMLLGNMSGFFVKGFNGHLENGMPWPFQNGLFCCTLYHFFVHDKTGPIGLALRNVIHSMPFRQGGLDDETFAVVAVGVFMQVTGFLQLPQFLGPGFSPFNSLIDLPVRLFQRLPKAEVNLVLPGVATAYEEKETTPAADGQPPVDDSQAATQKKRRRRNKKKEL